MATDEELRKYAIRATHRIRLLLEIYAPEQLVREQVEYLAATCGSLFGIDPARPQLRLETSDN